MNRETKELITSIDNHKVAIKMWLTEKENRLIQKFWAGQATISEKADADNIKEDDVTIDITKSPETILKYYDVLTEAHVYSLDGDSDNIVERLQDLRKEEFREVIDFINKITKVEDKKKLETPSNIGDSLIAENQN